MVVPLFFAPGTQSQAAIVNSDGTGVTSIDDLVVDGVTYDIIFANGTYTGLFGSALFTNADKITDEINILLNAIIPVPLISESASVVLHRYGVPLEIVEAGAVFAEAGICAVGSTPGPCSIPAAWTDSSFSLGPLVVFDWAVPELRFGFVGCKGTECDIPAVVPLPAALPLFGSALAMLGMVGWRRKWRAAA